MSVRILEGSYVLIGEANAAPVRNGAVVLDETERVIDVGDAAEMSRRYPVAWRERHDAVLTPGLVNAHTHLELSALRGQVPGGRGFGPWVGAMLEQRDRLQPERDQESIEEAVSELLRFGTVAVGEVTNSLGAVAALSSAPMYARMFHEVYGLKEETARVMMGFAQQDKESAPVFPPHLSYTLSIHSLYSTHPAVIREIAQMAVDSGIRTTLHLAEHPAERAYLKDGTGPLADFFSARGVHDGGSVPRAFPISYAADLGALGPHVLGVHLADARTHELKEVSEAGMQTVLCPRSNLYIELRLPPFLDMIQAGIKPALGTDSLASNSTLDVLAEALSLHERFPSVSPTVLIAMATSFGARALQLEDRVGALKPGLSPGVIAFPHGADPPSSPEIFVLRCANKPRRVLSRPRMPEQ